MITFEEAIAIFDHNSDLDLKCSELSKIDKGLKAVLAKIAEDSDKK
jgi:hypothetical protein